MEQYDPSKTPDPQEWIALAESQQIALVQQFHVGNSEEIPEGSEKIHAVIHVVVENQIAMGEEIVVATIAKLRRQGLGRHEAIHAVGAILCDNIFELLRGDQNTWNKGHYRKRLEKLTAKRWRKGKW